MTVNGKIFERNTEHNYRFVVVGRFPVSTDPIWSGTRNGNELVYSWHRDQAKAESGLKVAVSRGLLDARIVPVE